MSEKSVHIRVDPSFITAMELTRERSEANYKLAWKTDDRFRKSFPDPERKFSDREVTKTIAMKILHDNYRMPIEQVMMILNGHDMRKRR
jgi:hypothetical protein